MTDVIKSRRGVYYDLTHSPYEYRTPYGECFKFSSKKKLEIYTRDIPKEVEKLEKIITRNDMQSFLPDEIVQLLIKTVYQSFYKVVEG